MLSKVEILILKHLYDNQINNQMKSQTIKTIAETNNLNYFRARNIINHLFTLQLISQGYKEKNANTFYINDQGIEIIKREDDFSSSLNG